MRYLALCLLWVAAVGGVGSVVAGDESSLQGENLILKTAYGTTFDAYASGPKTADKGILLFHGDGGFDEGVRRWADRFAEQGYRVVVADLFDGRRSSEREFARLISRQIDPVWVDANVDAALSYLLEQPGRRLSAVGWGFGAEQALRVSLKHPDYIAVAVVYYPPTIDNAVEFEALEIPVLGIYGRQQGALQEAGGVVSLEGAMLAMRGSVVVSFDEEAGFAEYQSPTYNAGVAEEAWDETQLFLKEYLR